MKLQQSVVLIKPDALQRSLLGEIITRFERKGMKMAGIKMMYLTDEILDKWYVHHKGKDFFADLKLFMKSAPIVAMLWEGIDAVETVRKLVGATHGREAEAGSVRGDYSMSQQLNLIHASDSVETAEKEKGLVFGEKEIIDWKSRAMEFVYSKEERE